MLVFVCMCAWRSVKEIKSHWNRIKSLNKGKTLHANNKNCVSISNNVYPETHQITLLLISSLFMRKWLIEKPELQNSSMRYLKSTSAHHFQEQFWNRANFHCLHLIDVLMLDGKQNKIVDSATQEFESNLIKNNKQHAKSKWLILINLSFLMFGFFGSF